MTMEKEIFKPLSNYDGRYLISSHGRIFSVKRHKFINSYLSNRGYFVVTLYDKNTKKPTMCNVHRLVAETFIPNPDNLSDCNHINEIKTDNRVENLQWLSHKDNCNYGDRNRKISAMTTGKAHRHSRPVINEDTGEYYNSILEASISTGIRPGTICDSCNRQYKNKHKHNWKYATEK